MKTQKLDKDMKQWETLRKFVDDLRSNSSMNDKVDIIKRYTSSSNQESVFIKNILLYTYHPLWQYNITSDNLKKKKYLVEENSKYVNIFNLLDDLKNRIITGHNAIMSVNGFVNYHPEYEELIHCIIDKDLKTRAGDKVINKAIPDHIPEFSVALADKYDSNNVSWDDEWYVSRKLDGVRCIAIVDSNSNATFYSRTGKEIDTLDVVADGIRALNITNTVFDGEICLIDDDGNEDFQGIMKELRKKDHTIPNPSYKIFDCLSFSEFYSGKSFATLSKRLNHLKFLLHDNTCPCLSVLQQEIITDDDHFQKWVDYSSKYGWEGLMLRKNTVYKGKRSKDLLKYKSFHDAEYTVKNLEFGPFRYVKDGAECEEVMLSAVYIEHNGHAVKVGSGFTIEQRQHYFLNPEKLMGSQITVQYFEETKNQDGGISLRFPTLKYIYEQKREC